MEERRIVLYDGDCGLCNRVVQFVIANENSKSKLCFAALQSKFATDFFLNQGVSIQLDTFYFYNGFQLAGKSKACFQLLKHLHWYWKFLYIGKLLPRFLADALYDVVARNRKKLFDQSCLLLNVQQDRFLG